MSNYNELYHYGIPGMKWGVRRFQNANGSYTPIGARRHSLGISGPTGSAGGSSRSSGGSRRKGIDKRKLARNIAIGVGAAALAGGAAYGIHRLRKSGKLPQMPDVYRDNLNVRKIGGPLQAKIGQKGGRTLGLPGPTAPKDKRAFNYGNIKDAVNKARNSAGPSLRKAKETFDKYNHDPRVIKGAAVVGAAAGTYAGHKMNQALYGKNYLKQTPEQNRAHFKQKFTKKH